MLDHLDARAARRWGAHALQRLGEQRAAIDDLNVYPVPDGDTGTNLYLTFEAAVAGAEQAAPDLGLPGVADAFARGALLGAHGSSGIILSQLLRGWADELRERPDGGPAAVRAALGRAAEQAYAAVGRPVEGTMLTVARAAAAGAQRGATLRDVVAGALGGAREALARTPDQLDVLARAGVVDAGGQGVVVLVDALLGTVTGRRGGLPVPVRRRSAERDSRPAGSCGEPPAAGPAYEVMYLLSATDDAVTGLRGRLDTLGDALVVVGGEGLWKVHVHTDDVGAVVEAAVEVGRPYRIRVTRFADPAAAAPVSPPASVAVLAVTDGPGLAALFRRCGAHVLQLGPDRRVATAELLAAVRGTDGQHVVVLPNDPEVLVVAQAAAAAARLDGLQVAVLPTRAMVQGLAAVAVHDPSADRSADLVQMSTAAGGTRYGTVTVADQVALTSAGRCRVGAALGVVEGEVVEIGRDLGEVAVRVAARLLSSGGELLTVVTGAHPGAQSLARAVTASVRATRRDVEVSVVDGGQPGYLLLGLE